MGYPGGMDAIITGWGMTNPNINRLQSLLGTTQNHRPYAMHRRKQHQQRMHGRFWRPLVVTDPDDGITYLVGNTSFGTSDCSTSAPGMWSKNVVVKDWIDSFISA